MKKTVFLCAVLLSVLLIVKGELSDRKDDSWYFLGKDLYDLSVCSDEQEFYTLAEKARSDLCYTNAKSTDKYRVSSILEYVENGKFNANAKNICTEMSEMFDSCKMYNGDEFYAVCNRIYNKYIAKSESELINTETRENNTEHICKNRIFHSKTDIAENGIFQKRNFISEKDCIAPYIFPKGCGEKYAVSPDGTVWLYGKNYLFVAAEDETRNIALINIADGSVDDCIYRFKNKAVFQQTEISTLPLGADGGYELFGIFSGSDSDNYIIAEKDSESGRFVCFSFEHYRMPRER